jgi:hypothetical protein
MLGQVARMETTAKMDPRNIGCGSVYWVEIAQNRKQYMAIVYLVITFLVCNI